MEWSATFAVNTVDIRTSLPQLLRDTMVVRPRRVHERCSKFVVSYVNQGSSFDKDLDHVDALVLGLDVERRMIEVVALIGEPASSRYSTTSA